MTNKFINTTHIRKRNYELKSSVKKNPSIPERPRLLTDKDIEHEEAGTFFGYPALKIYSSKKDNVIPMRLSKTSSASIPANTNKDDWIIRDLTKLASLKVGKKKIFLYNLEEVSSFRYYLQCIKHYFENIFKRT
jgi:hypothetical protein